MGASKSRISDQYEDLTWKSLGDLQGVKRPEARKPEPSMQQETSLQKDPKMSRTEDSHLLVDEDSQQQGCCTRDRFTEYARPCASEFFCVTIFVFVGTLSAATGSAALVAVAHGLTLALVVAAFGHVSGAHVNPAVTLGVWLSGSIDWLKAILYVISQLLGAMVGAAITKGVLDSAKFKEMHGGTPLLATGVTVGEGVLVEIAFTFILVLTVLMTAVDSDGLNPSAPLAIGFALLVSAATAGGISGSAINPARAFGPAVVATSVDSSVWDHHWIYWVAPATGAVIAALLYRGILASGNKRLLCKDKDQ